jgi:hypothetical protein
MLKKERGNPASKTGTIHKGTEEQSRSMEQSLTATNG